MVKFATAWLAIVSVEVRGVPMRAQNLTFNTLAPKEPTKKDLTVNTLLPEDLTKKDLADHASSFVNNRLANASSTVRGLQSSCDQPWITGTATYYGNNGAGGACGGDLGDFSSGGGSWVDGLFVAPASHLFCEGASGAGVCNPNSHHGYACGRCIEVDCLSATSGGSTGCTGERVTVVVTDQCPDVGVGQHCSPGSNHLDLSTLAFGQIADIASGVVNVSSDHLTT